MAVVAAFRHRIRAAHPLDQRVPAGLANPPCGTQRALTARTASRGPLAGGKANAADPKPLRFFRRIFLGLGPTCL
jgi:hypothetical protein